MPIDFKFLGVPELTAELNLITKNCDAATMAATKSAQSAIVTAVRSRMRGKPRWNHRGKSSVYPSAVNLGGSRNSPRSGGPGKFTGMLYAGVGGTKKPKSIAGIVTGGVGVGGSKLRPNNFKKAKIEAKYPFFEPGVKAAQPKIAGSYALAWQKAIERRGGL